VSTLEVLRAARAYISDPEHWYKGGYGYRGRSCALGACIRMSKHSWPEAQGALNRAVPDWWRVVSEETCRNPITTYNDRPQTTHADILALFDRAIAVEEAKAAEFDATPEPAPLVAA
jgi:hypothetical protein